MVEVKISDIDDMFEDIFKEVDFMYCEKVFEEYKEGYKYIVFLHKFYYQEEGYIYTKFIFYTDKNKNTLKKEYFKYLYDVNCVYTSINFKDIVDIKTKILNLIKEGDFGKNIKMLSELVKSPSTKINDKLQEMGVNDTTVDSFKYSPKVLVQPCSSSSFNFNLTVNNIEIELNIKKEEESFVLTFNLLEENIKIDKTNLDSLIQIIAETIKEKIKLKGE